MPAAAAVDFFLGCCQCLSWAQAMASARPFASVAALVAAADRIWAAADEAMMLEAFAGHARIGDRAALAQKFSAAAREQGRVAAATEAEIAALAAGNEAYIAKNGFLFIVCATGKSAAQMLALLETRLGNERGQELYEAAREQGKITALRLRQRVES
ncbi:2-oxo-4-hydroxy-4-carboxy-5-ureidoimidazoline decarboxylase [Exilibacterium tricleocarpae]|uniref:2-oxo-4-hydroxy-4-carboxy-5-ureidoimidazoline decarboxylase n=2 Tax=Exilibacterium tricleocarpae TaxID=2591008 RepID=A0A545UA20_9GAMM|nr:2-oxo-4-hydroxy-4-carboxy-5-ureidoimidazoline decarboxylase [Exilibacterium tricleocarpae]